MSFEIAPNAKWFYINRKNGDMLQCVRKYNNNPNLVELTRERFQYIADQDDYCKKLIREMKNAHRNETIHVIGTGPSMKKWINQVDWSKLTTIGCNGAPLVMDNLKYWIMVDDFLSEAVRNHREVIDEIYKWFKNDTEVFKFFHRAHIYHEDIELGEDKLMIQRSPGPVENCVDGFWWGGSVTMAGVELARWLGAKQIVLWGCDFSHDREHVYTGKFADPLDASNAGWKIAKLSEQYKYLNSYLKERKIRLLNACPGSALQNVEIISPETAFETAVTMPNEDPNNPSPKDVLPETGLVARYDLSAKKLILTSDGAIVRMFNFDALDGDMKHLKSVIKKLTAIFEEAKTESQAVSV